jgi:DNA-binding NtrC family response regulator
MPDNASILFVENDQLTARSVLRLLRRARLGVLHVSSCAEARATSHRFAIGIFDIDLGDGDGINLAAEMVADERVEGVVFFTACGAPERLREAGRLGEVIVKGSSGSALLDAVARATKPYSETPPAYGPVKKEGAS